MSKQLPVKKIYVDTKFRRKDSVSTSNFKVDLPYSLTFPDNAIFYIDDINIPNSFYVVQAGLNDKLYFRLTDGALNADYILTIPEGNFNGSQFATVLQEQLFAVTNGLLVQSSFDTRTQLLRVGFTNYSFRVFTDYELANNTHNWVGAAYDSKSLQTANELLTNTKDLSDVAIAGANVSFYLMLIPIRNIYIRSPMQSSFSNIGANGDSNILCKVPVNANYGEMITHSSSLGADFHNCSKATWKTLEILITDVNGTVVNLHGCNWSFSIIFSLQNTDL